jgi:transcriptional regulator with AAA-type ATPase domain
MVREDPTLSFLKRAEIFSSLGEEDLGRLAPLLKLRRCPKGEIVMHQGDFGDSIYFISEGAVDVFVLNQEGAESIIGHLEAGDFFGEMALLTGGPRSASIKVSADALFLILYKNDFDLFLKEHPHLALFFSKVLADRMRAATLRYIYQVGREEELRRLLSKGEEEHLTHLIGKTKQFQAIEERIDELAAKDGPLIIAGPKGTAKVDVARLVHLKSRRRERPFMTVDLGGGDEWRTYFNRIKSLIKNPEEERHAFEEFQISALFGHERGAMIGTETSRLGHIELAGGGTVVLKNIDHLSSGAREKLLIYLLEKKFYRLEGQDGRISDVRIIGVLTTDQSIEDAQKSLRGKVPAPLWSDQVELPPLVMRRRDIPVIAESYLEKHVLLTGKSIRSISPEAINILVRYSWPGNDRELESVIERGVLVCEGETLLDSHIFLGLAPYSEKGRFNLLRFEPFRNLFSSLKARTVGQALTVSFLFLIALLSLLGIQVGDRPLGPGLFWFFMFPGLLISYVFLGRLYCSICPLAGLARVFRKLGSRNLAAPRALARLDVAVAALFALAFLWFEALFGVRDIPLRTALFISAVALTVVLFNRFFREDVWCRHLCPMGYLGGVFSCLACVELRANNYVCTSQCKTTYCYKGDGTNAGCPMGLFPVSLVSNEFCKMCGTCVHNCQYKSIHLDLRWPGAELWQNRKEPNLATSLSIPALLGSLYPLILEYNHKLPIVPWSSFTLWFFVSIAFSLALFTGASLVRGRPFFARNLSHFGFVYLPLAFAGHIAFQIPFVREGLLWLAGRPLASDLQNSGTAFLQSFLVIMGCLGSLWILKKRFLQEDRSLAAAHGTLILLFGALLLAVLRG